MYGGFLKKKFEPSFALKQVRVKVEPEEIAAAEAAIATAAPAGLKGGGREAPPIRRAAAS